MKNLWLKKIICLLLAAVMLAGCGNQGAGGGPQEEDGQKGLAEGEKGKPGETATGRYREEEIDLTDELEAVSNLKILSDGTLLISDKYLSLIHI